MSKPKPPAAPDYRAAAEETGASASKDLERQTVANRPDMVTPWGAERWSSRTAQGLEGPVTRWTGTQTLDPTIQRSLDAELGQQATRSELSQSLLGRVSGQGGFGTEASFEDMTPVSAYDPSTLPDVPDFSTEDLGSFSGMRQRADDTAYKAITDRLDPRMEQASEAMEVKLRGQGLVPGTEAYDRAMQNFAFEKNDAYSQAQAAGVSAGRDETRLASNLRGQEVGERELATKLGMTTRGMYGDEQQAGASISGRQRQQEIAEYLTSRGVPLNEVNALMTGQQVQSPNMPSFERAGRTGGTDYTGAAKSGYQSNLDAFNVQQAQGQGLQSGLFNLAGAGMKAYAMSDRRLKKDITLLGIYNGLKWYTFKYIWGSIQQAGVMADEVLAIRPEAVGECDGFMTVNYGAL